MWPPGLHIRKASPSKCEGETMCSIISSAKMKSFIPQLIVTRIQVHCQNLSAAFSRYCFPEILRDHKSHSIHFKPAGFDRRVQQPQQGSRVGAQIRNSKIPFRKVIKCHSEGLPEPAFVLQQIVDRPAVPPVVGIERFRWKRIVSLYNRFKLTPGNASLRHPRSFRTPFTQHSRSITQTV